MSADLGDIDEFLIEVINNNLRTYMKEAKYGLDPFTKKHLTLEKTKFNGIKVEGEITDLRVKGLSDFELKSLHLDLQDWSLKFVLSIPSFCLVGNYDIKGKIKKIKFRKRSSFYVVCGLWVAAKASLKISKDKRLQLLENYSLISWEDGKCLFYLTKCQSWFIKMFVNTDSLLRKGVIRLKNKVVKAYLENFNSSSKWKIAKPFRSIVPGLSINEYVDKILAGCKEYILENDLDPLKLAEYSSNFSAEVLLFSIKGEVNLEMGHLTGLSSICRTGDCLLLSGKKCILFSCHLGLKDLQVYYEGTSKFFVTQPASLTAKIKDISVYYKFKLPNTKGSNPELLEFRMTKMSPFQLEVSPSLAFSSGSIRKKLKSIIDKIPYNLCFFLLCSFYQKLFKNFRFIEKN